MSHRATLPELGISRSQSARWQRIAGIPGDILDQYIDETIEAQLELTIAGVLRLAHPGRDEGGDERRVP